MRRPVSLALTAVVLGIIALGQILFAVSITLGLAASRLAPHHSTAPGVRSDGLFFGGLGLAIILALLATWSILTVVGLLRLRNWARISILIYGGCLTFFGSISAFATISAVFITLSAGRANLPPHLQIIILSTLGFFWLLTAAIGIWWLVTYSRASSRALFVRPSGYPEGYSIGPPSQMPGGSIPPLDRPGRFDHIPVPITIIACVYLFLALTDVLLALFPLPAFLLGLTLSGLPSHLMYLAKSIFAATLAYGLLKLENWARLLTFGFIGIGFLNAGLSFLPWYQLQYRSYDQQFRRAFHLRASTAAMPDFSHGHLIIASIFVIAFNGAIFWFLQRYRPSFFPIPAPASSTL